MRYDVDACADPQNKSLGLGKVKFSLEQSTVIRNVDIDFTDLDVTETEASGIQCLVQRSDDANLIHMGRCRRGILEVNRVRQWIADRQETTGVDRLRACQGGQASYSSFPTQIVCQVEWLKFLAIDRFGAVDLELRRQAGAALFKRNPRHIDPEGLEVRLL